MRIVSAAAIQVSEGGGGWYSAVVRLTSSGACAASRRSTCAAKLLSATANDRGDCRAGGGTIGDNEQENTGHAESGVLLAGGSRVLPFVVVTETGGQILQAWPDRPLSG